MGWFGFGSKKADPTQDQALAALARLENVEKNLEGWPVIAGAPGILKDRISALERQNDKLKKVESENERLKQELLRFQQIKQTAVPETAPAVPLSSSVTPAPTSKPAPALDPVPKPTPASKATPANESKPTPASKPPLADPAPKPVPASTAAPASESKPTPAPKPAPASESKPVPAPKAADPPPKPAPASESKPLPASKPASAPDPAPKPAPASKAAPAPAPAPVETPAPAPVPTPSPVETAGGDGIPTGDITKGAKLFKAKCAQCHTCEPGGSSKQGPALHGIIGRPAGSLAYDFTNAIKDSKIVWNGEHLFKFMLAPKKYVPGTKMVFAGLKKEQERADIVAYINKASTE